MIRRLVAAAVLASIAATLAAADPTPSLVAASAALEGARWNLVEVAGVEAQPGRGSSSSERSRSGGSPARRGAA